MDNDKPGCGSINLSRRSLLISSLGVTGGLLLGCSPPQREKTPGSPATLTPVNAYVHVSSDNVFTLFCPTSEMGQSTFSSLTKLLAEEMDVDWKDVQIETAPADPAYINPKTSRQRTANSEAIVGFYEPLRTIGASVREMMCRAAAQHWGVPAKECFAELGVVKHSESGRSSTYGALAEIAATLQPVESPALKGPEEFRYIGRATKRKDVPSKCTGEAIFGIDVERPDMLIATVKHVPILGAKITGFNAEAVRQVDGVVSVTQISDIAVAVVAETFWQAKKAADTLELEIKEPASGRLTSEIISQQLQDALDYDDKAIPFPKMDLSQSPPAFIPPDIPAASALLEDASLGQLRLEYEVPYLAHACMEPVCCTALVTNDSCEIWAPHQQPDKGVESAVRITGLAPEQISLNLTFLGGGFGRKWVLDFLEQSVEIAKAHKGRPIKLIWTREEDIKRSHFRPTYKVRTRAAIRKDGSIAAMHSRIAGQSIWRYYGRNFIPGMADPSAAGLLIYDAYEMDHQWIDHVELEFPVPIGYWRSVTLSQNCFFAESAVDEIAHFVGEDPYEYRRRLLKHRPHILKLLDKAAEMIGWSDPRPETNGLGIAVCYGFESICVQIVEVSVVDNALKVERVVCVFDCGTQIDPASVRAQLEGGIIFGLTAALAGEITLDDGQVTQSNFHDYPILSARQIPRIDIHVIDSDAPPGGAGEAGTPPVIPALTNAIYAATGKRLRQLPVTRSDISVRL